MSSLFPKILQIYFSLVLSGCIGSGIYIPNGPILSLFADAVYHFGKIVH